MAAVECDGNRGAAVAVQVCGQRPQIVPKTDPAASHPDPLGRAHTLTPPKQSWRFQHLNSKKPIQAGASSDGEELRALPRSSWMLCSGPAPPKPCQAPREKLFPFFPSKINTKFSKVIYLKATTNFFSFHAPACF